MRLTLLVLRCANVETTRRFYESLGLVFEREKHGSGPEHYSVVLDGTVLELYPGEATDSVRIGLQVPNVSDAATRAPLNNGSVHKPPRNTPHGVRAVLIDPDERRVELSEA